MKKILILSLLTTIAMGYLYIQMVSETNPKNVGTAVLGAQEEFLISPSVWVLGTKGIEQITIHIAVSYSQVETVDINIVKDEITLDEVESFSKFADNRGELVLKFKPKIVPAYENGFKPTVEVILNGNDDYSGTVTIKER